MDAPNWLRDLEAKGHLFDSDVAYFLHTGSVVTTSAKTAVASPEHSALLQQDVVRQKNFNVGNPPPADTLFKQLYDDTRAALVASGNAAGAAALPATAPAVLPDHHILSPDRIMQVDLKLRNVILGLISSRGRMLHYQNETQSGCALLRLLIKDSKATTNQFQQSPHTLQLKSQLQQLKKLTLSHPSQIEFDEIRDSIEESRSTTCWRAKTRLRTTNSATTSLD